MAWPFLTSAASSARVIVLRTQCFLAALVRVACTKEFRPSFSGFVHTSLPRGGPCGRVIVSRPLSLHIRLRKGRVSPHLEPCRGRVRLLQLANICHLARGQGRPSGALSVQHRMFVTSHCSTSPVESSGRAMLLPPWRAAVPSGLPVSAALCRPDSAEALQPKRTIKQAGANFRAS